MIVFGVAVLVSCDNAAEIKADIDSTADKVKNSETLDSIEAKGERILDTVKSKGGELWDSTKSKGGKLADKAEDKLDDLRKDSTK